MLSTRLQKASMAEVRRLLLLIMLGLWVLPANAQPVSSVSSLSASDMIQNLATQIPNLMQMVTAIAYVMGMYFVFFGILKLKQFGEQRSMMSQEHSIKGPIILITVGALLLYLPSSVQMGASTFWTDPNPYGYLQQQDQWSQFLNDVLLVMQLFGTIAFIRGLILLSHLGGHGGQPGTFGKAMAFMIGGIFCINIYQVIQVVMVTLGISFQ